MTVFNSALADALDQLEKELELAPPRGALGLPPTIRYASVLTALNARLCPHSSVLLAQMESRATEATTILVDAILSYVTALPFVATTVGRCIALYGLKRFCETPSGLVEPKS